MHCEIKFFLEVSQIIIAITALIALYQSSQSLK